MERYSHLQAMPNSPLSPLTPLSENTKFEFNFGGDGSLDVYIDSVRQEHRVAQQQKKLLQQANRIFNKKCYHLQPKRYTEEFLKLREVFEAHENDAQGQNYQNQYNYQQENCEITPTASTVKITHTGGTPTPTKEQLLNFDNAATPTNVRTPLKPKNRNVQQNIHTKAFHAMQQQKLQQRCYHLIMKPQKNRIFLKTSPVAAKPLCPQVAKILQQRGLSIYYGLFQREEIDLYTFHLLKFQDLQQMGIKNQKHCSILMHAIYYAGHYF